jgi:hypothetical protein
MLNEIVFEPGAAFELRIAWRSVFGPESAVEETTNGVNTMRRSSDSTWTIDNACDRRPRPKSDRGTAFIRTTPRGEVAVPPGWQRDRRVSSAPAAGIRFGGQHLVVKFDYEWLELLFQGKNGDGKT